MLSVLLYRSPIPTVQGLILEMIPSHTQQSVFLSNRPLLPSFHRLSLSSISIPPSLDLLTRFFNSRNKLSNYLRMPIGELNDSSPSSDLNRSTRLLRLSTALANPKLLPRIRTTRNRNLAKKLINRDVVLIQKLNLIGTCGESLTIIDVSFWRPRDSDGRRES